jgi:protein-tyrosine-phosphatase
MKTVYFICYGNLCRSPFAEKYAVVAAARLGLEGWTFDGAGIGASSGQPCPKPAIVAARDVEVDLSTHLAKHTTEIHPDAGDWIIAMDRLVFGSLANTLGAPLSEVKGPGGAHLELMMQSMAGHADASSLGLDVPDPMGQGVAVYRECYELLQVTVDRLLERISNQ